MTFRNGELPPSQNFHVFSASRQSTRNSIRAARRARRVTSKALAQALGVPAWKIQGYERTYAGSLPKTILKRLAVLLGTTVEDLSRVPDKPASPAAGPASSAGNLPQVVTQPHEPHEPRPQRQQKGQLLKLGVAFTVEGQYLAAGTIHIDTKVMHPLLKKALRDALAD